MKKENGLITARTYGDMQNKLTTLENEIAKAEKAAKKKAGIPLVEGVRNGVRGMY